MTNALNIITDFIASSNMAGVMAGTMGERRGNYFQKKALTAIASIEVTIGEGYVQNPRFKELKDAMNKYAEIYHATFVKNVYLAHDRDFTTREDDHFDTFVFGHLVSGYCSFLNMKKLPKNISATRKESAKATTPGYYDDVIEASEATAIVWTPVVEAMEELKGMIHKGRKPVTPKKADKPANPNQVRGTCPVCFGNYAVTRKGKGFIAEHGFKLVLGRTASCPGSHGIAFEESCDTTKSYLKRLENRLVFNGSDLYDYEVVSIEDNIAALEKRISDWQPVELKCSSI